MQVHIYIYMNVSKYVSSNLPNIALSTFCHCAATHLFFIFLFQSISVLLVYVRVCNLSALSPAVLSEIAEVIS